MLKKYQYPDKAISQIRIDAQLFARIKAIAKQESRSMNAQIELFLKDAVARYEDALAEQKKDQ